jgi:DNA-binding CsgD family transcriptional regulator
MSVQIEELEEVYSPSDLLERTEEIFEIERALYRLVGGSAGLLVVEGDAGSGRTSLLNQVVIGARNAGIPVLSASGGASERGVPFGLAGQLFGISPAPDGESTASQGTDSVFAAMYRNLTERCSAGPAVIVVDDVQLLDELSLRWLVYLSRRLNTLPAVLAVALSRDIEISPAGATLMIELRHRLDAVTLRPAPLSERAAAELLGKQTGQSVPQPAVAVCVELTNGNPLLLVELARTLAREDIDLGLMTVDQLAEIAPPSVAQYVLSKIAHLPAEVKQVALAVAVLGPSASSNVIATMCSVDESTVHDTLMTLNQLGIIRSIRPAQYVHPLVRNALYADMRADERQRYHQTAAALLRGERGRPSDVARHLLAASSTVDSETVEMLCQVAVDLIATEDHAIAADCLRRVMRGPISPARRGQLALTLGTMLETREPQAAIEYLRHAVATVDQPHQISEAYLALGRALASCGQTPEAVEMLQGCIERLADEQPALEKRVRDVQLMLSLLHGDTIGSAGAALSQATASIGGDVPTVPRAVRATWSGAGRIIAVRQMSRFLEEPPAPSEHPLERAAALLTLIYADHGDLAAGYLKSIADKAPRVAEVVTVRAAVELVNGDVSQAVRSARHALELVEAGAARPLLLDHRAMLAIALSESGEHAQAVSILGDTGAAGDQPDDWYVNHFLEARGRLRVAAGDVHTGLADLLECGRRLERWEVDNPLVSEWRSAAAIALSQVGDHDRALTLAEEQLRAAYFWGAPRAIGVALRARGLIEKEPQNRREWLTQAVDQLRNSPAVLDLAQSMLDLGTAMVLQEDLLPAREQLREGLAIAQRCGATALATRAHDELLRSGARPRRRAQFGKDSLTDAELRTALMATDGLTNRQIAKELYVTQRTVELHLTNTYRKLQVRNRAELGDALGGDVVTEP